MEHDNAINYIQTFQSAGGAQQKQLFLLNFDMKEKMLKSLLSTPNNRENVSYKNCYPMKTGVKTSKDKRD